MPGLGPALSGFGLGVGPGLSGGRGSGVAGTPTPLFSGGTITFDGSDVIHTFTANDTLTFLGGDPVDCRVLAVAGGGGGGGFRCGGGGGGGGVIEVLSVLFGANQAIVVGAGGAGGANVDDATRNGVNGGNTTVGTLITATGGGGGNGGAASGSSAGAAGGCGGGGGSTGSATTVAGGAGSQGGNGGAGAIQATADRRAGGGGGGAEPEVGAASVSGASAATTFGGNGGDGWLSDISGTATRYGGGGGGSADTTAGATGGVGGLGGGGNGAHHTAETAGAANTGGGGGGAHSGAGSPGGSGIVVVRYTAPVADPDIDHGVFWRAQWAADAISGNPGFTHPAEELRNDSVSEASALIGQRGNVQLVILHSSNASATVEGNTGGTVVALDSAASGRKVAVVLAPVYNLADGDTSSGATILNTAAGSGMHFRALLAGADGADPLGADGVTQEFGTGTVMTAAAKPITERCRVVRAWLVGDDTLPTAPTPTAYAGTDLGGNISASDVDGTDYAWCIQDLGTFEAGDTVPAQTSTLAASETWIVVTVPMKLYAAGDAVPQIVTTDFVANSSSSCSVLQSGGVVPLEGRFRVGDDVFLFVAGNSGMPSVNNGYTQLTANTGESSGIWHKRLTAADATNFNCTVSSGGSSITNAGWVVVRGLDRTTPYTIAEDTETEATHDVPAAVVLHARDMSLQVFQSRVNSATSPNFTVAGSKVWLTANNNNSNNRLAQSVGAIYGGTLTPGSYTPSVTATQAATFIARTSHLLLHPYVPA